MKECKCDMWQTKIAPSFNKTISPWDSSRPTVPMYFGIKIDFCPFCGKELLIAKK